MVPNRDNLAGIAELILSRARLTRGVVVLDKDLWALESALKDANIHVIRLRPGWTKEQLLSHRIVVTQNPDRFFYDAAVYDFGVIALNKLKHIDSDPSYKKNKTVRLLSRAMSRYKLWAKGAKFLLELRENGKHRLEELW